MLMQLFKHTCDCFQGSPLFPRRAAHPDTHPAPSGTAEPHPAPPCAHEQTREHAADKQNLKPYRPDRTLSDFPAITQPPLTILSDVVVSKSFVQKSMGFGFRIALASWFRPFSNVMAFNFLCAVTRELITTHFTNSFRLTGKSS